MEKLAGKVAVVTGGSKGIGLGIVKDFLANGARVIVADHNPVTAPKAVAALNNDRATFFQLDIAVEEQWQALFDYITKEFGHLDILVNNAGISPDHSIEDIEHITMEEWHKVIDVDLTSVVLGTHYAVLNMKETGGSIINLSSTAADVVVNNEIGYKTAKIAVRSVSQAAAGYCSDQGYPIRVNTISPGVIVTPMVEAALTPEFLATAKQQRILGTPENIATAATFLASDDGEFITGADLKIDGGFTLRTAGDFGQQ